MIPRDFDEKRVVGVILARGGSRGIPGKNLKPLTGKPLIVRAVEKLQALKEIDRIIVSTDDPRIARLAEEQGGEVPFSRPPELAQDDTPALAALEHAIERLVEEGERGGIVLLYQATSPCCPSERIRAALEEFRRSSPRYLQSVCRVVEHPHWMGPIEGGTLRFLFPPSERATRRQDLPALYRLNGAISIFRTELLLEGQAMEGDPWAFVMSPEESLDLDEPEDWEEAERQIGRQSPDSIRIAPITQSPDP